MEEALGPKIKKKLAKEEEKTNNYICIYPGNHMFEVEYLRRRFVVDVNGRSCGCRKRDVSHIAMLFQPFYTMETPLII